MWLDIMHRDLVVLAISEVGKYWFCLLLRDIFIPVGAQSQNFIVLSLFISWVTEMISFKMQSPAYISEQLINFPFLGLNFSIEWSYEYTLCVISFTEGLYKYELETGINGANEGVKKCILGYGTIFVRKVLISDLCSPSGLKDVSKELAVRDIKWFTFLYNGLYICRCWPNI